MKYKIEGNITPMPFQHEGINMILQQERSILADEMGLGKTIQSAVAIRNMSESGKLVICPASIKLNWEREILKMYPSDTVWIGRTRTDYIPAGYDWYIVNYDLLVGLKDQLLIMANGGIIDSTIIDEAHMIKNMGSKKKPIERTVYTLEIAGAVKKVLPVTGSPITNKPQELYTLLRAVGHPLGHMPKTSYESRYCNGTMKVLRNGIRYWDASGASNLTELNESIQGTVIRRKKAEVLQDLPDKTITRVYVEMTDEWKKKYENVWEDYIERAKTELQNSELSEVEIAEKLVGRLDAQNLIELGKMKQVTSQAKINRIVKDIINITDQDQKVIVFSQYTAVIDEIIKQLTDRGIRSVSITGQHDQDQRQRAVDKFQTDPNYTVFVGNIKAAGVGITLTAATVVLFVDMEWSPEIQAQAEDRAHRIGQKNAVNVYYYLAQDTVDEHIYNILQDKRVVINAVIDGVHTKKETVEK